ncbi:putative kinetochore protein spc24 [Cyphellophora attinorum]|uniref:Kinetochore protein Spc24 n=1 Tax=Cyphellophora attinorum TaxID=1664694 RepID=A0A0N1HGM9_9EURO|nr:putative kinetochore protein spc24 [Phialophora attinorum]KPI34627.1 putative kinetochore protein spc24 [Phialophora attinorum]
MLYTEEKSHAELISHCVSNFNIHPDKLALNRIDESLSTIREMRSMRITSAADALRRLARQHAHLSTQHRDLTSSYSPNAHSAEILGLDDRKFRVAKQTNDLEVENERLEAELEHLRLRLGELEEQGVEGDERARRSREADDPTVLRLWLYRNLGITLDEGGGKATVGDSRKGDVHVVNIDPKFSRWFYADYFWGVVQG